MRVGYKEERHYGRGQCHDHVDIARDVYTIRQTQASMGVPGSWSSLLRDRYSAIVSSRSIHIIALPLVGGKIFNASSCSCHEGKTRDCTFLE